MQSLCQSMNSLSTILSIQREERLSSLVDLIDNLYEIKSRLEKLGNQEVIDLLDEAINQCQQLRMLN